ncbi:alpha/beta fold hydrolase [Nocardia sp. 2]|uniref:Alpha/beta fold hydrolase n=1 Tax=Nocardia acididurans TaxID=2802282 RepID=A0ABS1LYX7_9NOCA|nr:alpha/beta fold hydrolase [Nocardia acididurans]MBL1072975.1 alpha/beta fold hydrolase [Nocardia acididurans]
MLLAKFKTMLLAGLAGALAATLAIPGTASAADLPVVWGMGPFIDSSLNAKPPYDPPGGNDWTCKPTAAHPLPVVLVHGAFGNGENSWQAVSPLLKNEGHCVFALSYGTYPGDSGLLGGVGGRIPIMDSVPELARFVDQVLAATGAPKVKLLTWSEGTLVSAAYIQFLGGDQTVDAQVSLAPIWKGTHVAQSLVNTVNALGIYNSVYTAMNPPCAACADLLAGSAFIDKLQASGVYSDKVRYYSVLTETDGQVVPYTQGLKDAPNATNVILQHGCSEDLTGHLFLTSDPRAVHLAVQGLDPELPRTIPCAPNATPAGI